MREHELAGRAVLERERSFSLRIDHLDVHEPARADMHPRLLLAFAEERDADVADTHRLGHLGPPARLELRPELRLAAARLARDEDALDTRRCEIRFPLGEVGRVRRRQHDGLRSEQFDRPDEPLGVAGAERDVREADPLEGGERRPGDEGPCVVRRRDALTRFDARRCVATRRRRDPVVEVAGGQRDVARRAGRSTRRVDPHELRLVRAEMCADRIVLCPRCTKLVLLGQRQVSDLRQACPLELCEPVAIERGPRAQVVELFAEARVVERELVLPRTGLDLGIEHHSYSTASSATRPR